MTSGLYDNPPPPCDNEDTAKACLTYTADAGTRWSYHTGAYKKVQDVVATAVGQNYNTVTNNWVEAFTGMSGIWVQQMYYSKARDMARFGLLNLHKGIWQADTVLKDSVYFNAMVNTSQNLNKAYGYLWWLNGKSSLMTPGSQIVFPGTLMSNAPNDMYAALGKNDQKIYVVPSQQLVVIRQGNTAGGFNLAASAFDNVLWDYINKLSCGTGVEENELASKILVYPNPSSGSFTIESSLRIKKVMASDVLGREFEVQCNNGNVNMEHFTKGVYFLKITLDQQEIVKRIIVN